MYLKNIFNLRGNPTTAEMLSQLGEGLPWSAVTGRNMLVSAHGPQGPGENTVLLMTFTEDQKEGKWTHSLHTGFPVFHQEISSRVQFLFPFPSTLTFVSDKSSNHHEPGFMQLPLVPRDISSSCWGRIEKKGPRCFLL